MVKIRNQYTKNTKMATDGKMNYLRFFFEFFSGMLDVIQWILQVVTMNLRTQVTINCDCSSGYHFVDCFCKRTMAEPTSIHNVEKKKNTYIEFSAQN